MNIRKSNRFHFEVLTPKPVLTSFIRGMVFAVVSLLALASPSWARLAPFDGIGGAGGAPYRLDCGESAVLVGVTGQSGLVIDRLAGLCVKIDPVSGTWVGGVYETAPAGGTGGSRFHNACPVGQALVGLEGTIKYFSGTNVVASLGINCTALKIRTEYQPPVIKGFRQVGIYGDPDPLKVEASQDLCYRPLAGNNRSQDDWTRVGVALEGRAGLFLDRVHLTCGELLNDQQGYRVTFRTSAKSSVLEGTPLNIQWRASGAKPELTPNLQYSWELQDWTHTKPGMLGPQPTIMQNACAYAAQPCSGGWSGSQSESQVTFIGLPAARYELRLTVRPTVPAPVQSNATQAFEIAPNQLVEVTVNPGTVRPGQASTATVVLEGPTPPRGKTIYLSSSNASLVPVPPSIVIPGGTSRGTVALRSGSPISAGQVTITASLLAPFSQQVIAADIKQTNSLRVLSRGLEGTEQTESAPTEEKLAEPTGEPVASTEVPTPSETSEISQDVQERGVRNLTLRPSTTLSQASNAIVATPVQKAPMSAALSEVKSAVIASQALALPSATKQAVLTIQPDLQIQQNNLMQTNPKRFQIP
ncbi:MAG: hypothetical protein Q7U76_11395 [Nitrospirota bacterium]|nr:hypothetical protein [Nitrospirota bacterium]